MSNQLTIVVGAGASKDCVAEGSISEFDGNWRPPLASELFDSRAQFNSILKNYPKARALSEEIRVRLRANGNLETILREFRDSADFQVRKQVLEIPLYLQELLWTISDRFILAGGSKFDTFVRRVLTSPFDRVMFLSLNYDLFLEKALSVFADRAFVRISDYLPAGTKWSLVKPHGSVNWARELVNDISPDSGVNDFVRSLSGPPELSGEIVILQGSNGLDGFDRKRRVLGRRYLYPLMVLPMEGSKNFLCPDEHIAQAKEFQLRGCENFLFVGFSGLDENVLDLLIDVSTVKRIMVVCGDKNSAGETFQRLRRRNDRLLPASGNVDRCLYESGFRSFVESQAFEIFLAGTQ